MDSPIIIELLPYEISAVARPLWLVLPSCAEDLSGPSWFQLRVKTGSR